MWDLPGPGLKPVSPALAGGFLITAPPGKPLKLCFFKEAFHHSTVRNKDYQKVWSSPSDPVPFEVDASHEKLESVSEADAMNFSSLF